MKSNHSIYKMLYIFTLITYLTGCSPTVDDSQKITGDWINVEGQHLVLTEEHNYIRIRSIQSPVEYEVFDFGTWSIDKQQNFIVLAVNDTSQLINIQYVLDGESLILDDQNYSRSERTPHSYAEFFMQRFVMKLCELEERGLIKDKDYETVTQNMTYASYLIEDREQFDKLDSKYFTSDPVGPNCELIKAN